MVSLTMSEQCFSLETVISEILLMMFTWDLVYQNGVSPMVLGPLVASLDRLKLLLLFGISPVIGRGLSEMEVSVTTLVLRHAR